jgi:hypothetical protein
VGEFAGAVGYEDGDSGAVVGELLGVVDEVACSASFVDAVADVGDGQRGGGIDRTSETSATGSIPLLVSPAAP